MIENQEFSDILDRNNLAQYSIPGAFPKLSFTNCSFDKVQLIGYVFGSCNFQNCTFNNFNARKARFSSCQFENCEITNSNMTRAEFYFFQIKKNNIL